MPSGHWFLAECMVSKPTIKTQTRPFFKSTEHSDQTMRYLKASITMLDPWNSSCVEDQAVKEQTEKNMHVWLSALTWDIIRVSSSWQNSFWPLGENYSSHFGYYNSSGKKHGKLHCNSSINSCWDISLRTTNASFMRTRRYRRYL